MSDPRNEAPGPFPFDRSHGSLFDRGSADSYYRRGQRPHYGGVGGDSGPEVLIAEEDLQAIAEYRAGYEFNEKLGDFKDWG